jgi:hypothetical protein
LFRFPSSGEIIAPPSPNRSSLLQLAQEVALAQQQLQSMERRASGLRDLLQVRAAAAVARRFMRKK